jgi:hypothetical protein
MRRLITTIFATMDGVMQTLGPTISRKRNLLEEKRYARKHNKERVSL